MIASASAEPLLEQRAVEPRKSDVARRLPCSSSFARPGNADHRPVHARADQEAGAGGASGRSRSSRSPSRAGELRPDVDDDPVGEAARLEVALEREQAVGRQLQPVGELLRLVVVVSYMPGAESATTRTGRPAPSIAARPARRRGNSSSPFG